MDNKLISLHQVYKYHYTERIETAAINNLSLEINKVNLLLSWDLREVENLPCSIFWV